MFFSQFYFPLEIVKSVKWKQKWKGKVKLYFPFSMFISNFATLFLPLPWDRSLRTCPSHTPESQIQCWTEYGCLFECISMINEFDHKQSSSWTCSRRGCFEAGECWNRKVSCISGLLFSFTTSNIMSIIFKYFCSSWTNQHDWILHFKHGVLRETFSSHLRFHFLITEPHMDHGVGLPSHQVGILQVPGIRSTSKNIKI